MSRIHTHPVCQNCISFCRIKNSCREQSSEFFGGSISPFHLSCTQYLSMVEVWKEIENHKGYMVSTKGNVKSLSFNRTGKEKVLTPCVDSKGYLFVTLQGKQLRVHRLVASAFLGNGEGLLVNHKDENKRNNNVDNLEWCNAAYNLSYNGNRKRISQKHQKKICAFQENEHYTFESITKAASYFCVSIQAISRCLNGKCKTSCGYRWKYL